MDPLTAFGPSQLVGFVLVLARLSPLFLLAPLFGSKLVPARVRAIVALALALGLAPLALRGQRVPLDAMTIAELLLKELLVGLAFAFAVGVLFAALSVAGALLDTLIGFAYGALVDPLTGNQGTVLQQLYGLVGVLVFISIGGDAVLVRGLAETYDLVGLLEQPALGVLLEGARQAFTGIFASALQVAAPVLLALVLTDAAFGLVSRVVPQLNVFAVGAPAKVLVGLLLIGASLPFVTGLVADQFQGTVTDALNSIGVAP
jgi:flagellar biosynthetic protein FliR